MATAFKADFLAEPVNEVPALEVFARPLPHLDKLPEMRREVEEPSQAETLLELGLDSEVLATVADPGPQFFSEREASVFRPLYVVEMTLQSGLRKGETIPLLTHMLGGFNYLRMREAVASGETITIQLIARRFHTSALLVATAAE